MVVAFAVLFKKSLVLTRSNNRAVTQRHHRNRVRVVVRIGNADVPVVRAAVCGFAAVHLDIAAQPRQNVPLIRGIALHHFVHDVACVALADAAQINLCAVQQLHLIVAEQLDVLIADMRQRFINLALRGHTRVVRADAPEVGQRRHRRVKRTVCHLGVLERFLKRGVGVIAHLGRLTVRVVQLVEIARLLRARERCVQLIDALLDLDSHVLSRAFALFA